jgi:hypothetical protein
LFSTWPLLRALKAKKALAKDSAADTGAAAGAAAGGGGGDGGVKVDPKHQNTVLMMSCVILATPYDLPSYVPALVTSFVRHAAFPTLKDPVTRTVQLFKRTHQDRWEEFKRAFSTDQLDELQGTGAAHYYS